MRQGVGTLNFIRFCKKESKRCIWICCVYRKNVEADSVDQVKKGEVDQTQTQYM